MLVLGLTGGIGSGKSSAAHAFSEAGFTVLDADQIARDVIEPGTPGNKELRTLLDDAVFDEKGRLDRAAVRAFAFDHPEVLKQLESVIHPRVSEHFKTAIATAKSNDEEAIVLEIPLLLEAGLQHLVDKIIVVDLPETQQIERAMRRDGADQDGIKSIMAKQAARVERLQQADFVLDNSNDLNTLKDQIHYLISHLRSLS